VCNAGLGTCSDPFTGTIGGTCSRRDPTTCAGGTCLSERSSGFPGAGYCSYAGCGTSEPCPGTSVCAPRPGTTSICLAHCTSDTDCRTGYHCLPSDPSMPSSPTACLPGCSAPTDCTSMGDVCNVGTGLCTQPFMAANEGIACTSDAACPSGRCLTEATYGYPGGMCVYPGCSLVTGGTGAVCPAMSTCVEDGVGSPDLGVCAPTCTVGGSSCRAGYACVAMSGSTTEGTCQPACTAASCATGRTCDMTTGLCH
jgi:hypothetical protein